MSEMPGTGECRGEVLRKTQTAPPGGNPECWEPRVWESLAEGKQAVPRCPSALCEMHGGGKVHESNRG